MLNFLNKTTPLIVASLLVAASGFAQDTRSQKKCFDQGLEMPVSQTLAAHSYPARQEVRGSWDVRAGGSYIFWQARQDNMDLGVLSDSALVPAFASGTSTVSHNDFAYKSGFKADFGVNFDYDNWDALAEYTWFHGTTNTAVAVVDGQFLYPAQLMFDVGGSFTNGAVAWELKMDFADISLARSFYSGTKFTLRPFFGARGAWIRQYETSTYTGGTIDADVVVEQRTVSQGVGPRAGVNSNWLLGYGLRLEGNVAGDLLYTRYNYSGTQTSTLATGVYNDSHDDTLRAHSDLELGMGWGSYFDNNNWYFDLSASYGFQAFWNQNMFSSGDLYVHGLTVNAQLDF